MSTLTDGLRSGLRPRRWLGHAGLAPFTGCVAILLLANNPRWQAVAASQLLIYGALIASLLGAALIALGMLRRPRVTGRRTPR